MRGLPDLSAIMTVELNLPSVELPAPSNEMAIAGTTDASPYYQDSSAGTITLAPKKKKGEKRPRDDLPVNVGSEVAPVEAEIPSQEETAEPSSKRRKERQSAASSCRDREAARD